MKRVLKVVSYLRGYVKTVPPSPMKRVLKAQYIKGEWDRLRRFPMKRVLKGHGRRSRQSGNNYWISLNGC
jgi:hypothetical protein